MLDSGDDERRPFGRVLGSEFRNAPAPREAGHAHRHREPVSGRVTRREERPTGGAAGEQFDIGRPVDQRCVQGGPQRGVVRELGRAQTRKEVVRALREAGKGHAGRGAGI